MASREDAAELLRKMCFHSPNSFRNKIGSIQKGTGFVLAYLAQADGEVIAGDLAKRLNVSTARVAALLRSAEKDGLITRRGSSEDARRTVVELTPAGRAQAGALKEQAIQKMALLLDRVGKDDLEEFIRILREINAALSD